MKKTVVTSLLFALLICQACKDDKPISAEPSIAGSWQVDSTIVRVSTNDTVTFQSNEYVFMHLLNFKDNTVEQNYLGNFDTTRYTMLTADEMLTDLDFDGVLNKTNIIFASNQRVFLNWVVSSDTMSTGDIRVKQQVMHLRR